VKHHKTPSCDTCGRSLSEDIGTCTVCRENSHEYNPTPEEIASMCRKMRDANMETRGEMALDQSQDSTYYPRIFRISKFHKS
jgi:hypothetical protein